jgi:hypothetical protein
MSVIKGGYYPVTKSRHQYLVASYAEKVNCSFSVIKHCQMCTPETSNVVITAYHHHHHHISVMELGHLLTHSGLTYPEVSSKACHDSFCQLENSVSIPWVIYYKAFYLHVMSSFSCTPVICPKLVLFVIPL